MIRSLLVSVCLLSAGCIVPQVHQDDLVHGAKDHRVKTVLVDESTQAEVSDAAAILILFKRDAYLPDGGLGEEKQPSIIIRPYEQLGHVTITDRELYVWPFFALGTTSAGAEALIYKRGYMPVEFPLNKPSGYPERLAMIPCDPTHGKQALANLVFDHIRKEEWKDYARKAIEKL